MILLLFLSLQDEAQFRPCDIPSITQAYRSETHYFGGVRALRRFFMEHYQTPENGAGHSGFIRIRFVVSCKGETGWWDVLQCTRDYKPKVFPAEIKNQLLELTQTLDDWVPGLWKGKKWDSFYYITFKLKEGRLEDLGP